MPVSSFNVAVLLSGGGRTLQNFVDLHRAGKLPSEIPLVIGSKPDLYGLERARKAGIPYVHVVERKSFPSVSEFSRRIFDLCDQHQIGLVALAGWLSLLDIPDRYNDRIMNIHPALLPSFGGKGMFGHHVHQAVLDAGCKVSGCTVHFCDNAYDTGPIIIQRTCPVEDDDTPDTLARRVFEQETIAYPQAIEWYAQGRLKINGKRVKVLPKH
jgi:formyltetrahydrofolate-dependent phosphoribosylglycinamide formyltransferase